MSGRVPYLETAPMDFTAWNLWVFAFLSSVPQLLKDRKTNFGQKDQLQTERERARARR